MNSPFLLAMIQYENLQKVNQPFIHEYKSEFEKVLNSGWFVLGENVAAFEKEYANYCEVPFCVGVGNGLEALVLSIKALGIEKGMEIIVPCNTFIASILAVIEAGCVPVLVDVDLKTYNIDPSRIEEKITAKTRAVMAVHLFGKCCEMNSIIAICKKYHLFLIEDAAQAHGASYKGNKAGSMGDANGFSFYPAKNLGALGDGGAVTVKNYEIYDRVRKLRNYGSDTKYVNEIIGFNSRLDELQAAFLRIKLKSLDSIIAHKRKLAKFYLDYLKEDYIKPVVHPDYIDVYHIFNIRHPKRDLLQAYLLKNEIQTMIHYPIPPHKQPALQGYFVGESYSITEEIHNTTLSLPISASHVESEIIRVIELMNKF
jgi:dTDP-4-amino-4,6-dideoxygalactose transaminase